MAGVYPLLVYGNASNMAGEWDDRHRSATSFRRLPNEEPRTQWPSQPKPRRKLEPPIPLFKAPLNRHSGAELGGTTIYPGVYKNASSVGITTGPLTLDAQGNPNATWVFQIGSSLTVGTPTRA